MNNNYTQSEAAKEIRRIALNNGLLFKKENATFNGSPLYKFVSRRTGLDVLTACPFWNAYENCMSGHIDSLSDHEDVALLSQSEIDVLDDNEKFNLYEVRYNLQTATSIQSSGFCVLAKNKDFKLLAIKEINESKSKDHATVFTCKIKVIQRSVSKSNNSVFGNTPVYN